MSDSENTNVFINYNNNEFNEFKKLKGLKVIHFNIQSVVNKICELKAYINLIKPEIICLTESWLTNKHFDCEFNINDYSLYRKDRLSIGGGIAVYVNNRSNFTHEFVDIDIKVDFEFLVLKIKNKISKPFYLLTLYLTPNSMNNKIIEQFNEIIDHFVSEECLIVGDINVDISVDKNNIWSTNLRDYGFDQLISEPTRLTATLDHFYTNRPNNISGKGVLKISLSDHFPIYLSRKHRFGDKVMSHFKTKIYYRNWKIIDKNSIENSIKRMDLDLNLKDVNKSCNDFNLKINKIFNNQIPLKSKRISIQTKDNWISSEIISLMNTRDEYKRKYLKSIRLNHSIELINYLKGKYQNLRNKTRYEIRKTKKKLY